MKPNQKPERIMIYSLVSRNSQLLCYVGFIFHLIKYKGENFRNAKEGDVDSGIWSLNSGK